MSGERIATNEAHPKFPNVVVVPSQALIEREHWNRWAPTSYLGCLVVLDADGTLVVTEDGHVDERFAPGDWASVTVHAPSGDRS